MAHKSAVKNLAFQTRTGSSSTRASSRGHGHEFTEDELNEALRRRVPDLIETLKVARAVAPEHPSYLIAQERVRTIANLLQVMEQKFVHPERFAFPEVFLMVARERLSRRWWDQINEEVRQIREREYAELGRSIDTFLREQGFRK
jgi:hypothetical protein